MQKRFGEFDSVSDWLKRAKEIHDMFGDPIPDFSGQRSREKLNKAIDDAWQRIEAERNRRYGNSK